MAYKLDKTWSTDQTSSDELLETGLYSDAEIQLGEHSWKVHKMIVCVQSGHLKAALMGNFKEATDGVVKLDEGQWTEDAISGLLKFLYTGTIDITSFHVPKIRDLVIKIRDEYTNGLAKTLCQRKIWPKPPAEVSQVLKVVATLSETSIDRGDFRVTFLRASLLRLVLCCAQRFDIKELCHKSPTFLEFCKDADAEEAFQLEVFAKKGLDERRKRLDAEAMRFCVKCGAKYSVNIFVDTMEHVLHEGQGGVSWRCDECFVVPSLKQWKMVARIMKLRAEEDEMNSRIRREKEDMACRLQEARMDLSKSRGI